MVATFPLFHEILCDPYNLKLAKNYTKGYKNTPRNIPYFLSDCIYNIWPLFFKPIHSPVIKSERKFTQKQESALGYRNIPRLIAFSLHGSEIWDSLLEKALYCSYERMFRNFTQLNCGHVSRLYTTKEIIDGTNKYGNAVSWLIRRWWTFYWRWGTIGKCKY